MVTWRNRCHAPAPSIAAASYISSGMAWRPASSVMAKNGMPHQTLATIGPHMASRGSPRMLSGAARMPSATSQCGRGPITGLNSQAKVRPERKLGTAQGTKTSACTSRRPANGSRSRRARPKPSANWSRSEAKVHSTVLPRAFQNTGSRKHGLEVGEADPAALERVRGAGAAEGVGHADDQRHQHQRARSEQRRAQSRSRARARQSAAPRAAAAGRLGSSSLVRCQPFLLGIRQELRPLVGHVLWRCAGPAAPPGRPGSRSGRRRSRTSRGRSASRWAASAGRSAR